MTTTHPAKSDLAHPEQSHSSFSLAMSLWPWQFGLVLGESQKTLFLLDETISRSLSSFTPVPSVLHLPSPQTQE